ncbi:MAG: zinc ribbon domain-containing protein [Thermodesulfobacteriota bacterium]
MLLTIVGLVLVLAAAAYVAWPLLAPGEPLEAAPGATPDAGEITPEKEKELALLAIREADFDHRTGKLSDEDHAALRAELEERALRAIAAVDSASALHAVPPAAAPGASPASPPPVAGRAAGEAAGFCPGCGQRFARAARFCHACGRKLPATKERGRRRA